MATNEHKGLILVSARSSPFIVYALIKVDSLKQSVGFVRMGL